MVGAIRLCVVLELAALASGCATQASNESGRISQGYAAMARDVETCYAKAETAPEYRELGALLPPLDGRRQASLAQLSNSQTPTPEQSAALLRLYNDNLRPCYDMGLARTSSIDPGAGAILGESLSLSATAYARLASRRITWGQYAEFQNQLRAAAATVLAQHNQRVADRLQSQHTQEVQARGSAFVAASNTMYQWQMVTAANQPRSTNCNIVGGYLNCTTY